MILTLFQTQCSWLGYVGSKLSLQPSVIGGNWAVNITPCKWVHFTVDIICLFLSTFIFILINQFWSSFQLPRLTMVTNSAFTCNIMLLADMFTIKKMFSMDTLSEQCWMDFNPAYVKLLWKEDSPMNKVRACHFGKCMQCCKIYIYFFNNTKTYLVGFLNLYCSQNKVKFMKRKYFHGK